MAPRKENPLDPERIDISLDLIGEGSLAAVEQLAEQLKIISDYMANVQSRSSEGAAEGARAIGNSLNYHHKVVPSGSHPYGSHSADSPSVPNNAGQGASYSQEVDRQILADESGRGSIRRLTSNIFSGHGIGGALDRELEYYGATEREQARRRGSGSTPDEYEGTFYGASAGDLNIRGGLSSGASVSSVVDPNSPAHRQNLQANMETWERAQEQVRLPPGGLSMNAQDRFRLGADYFTRLSERQYQRQAGPYNEALSQGLSLDDLTPPDPTAGRNAARMAMVLRLGQEQAAAPLQLMRDLHRKAMSAYTYAGGYQQAGVAAGYERAGQINIPGTNIGITNPLDFFKRDSAAREGLNQRINTTRLSLMGGISGQQASEIVGGLAGSGWTGEQGQNAAFDAIAPLVQQGQNPNLAVGSFDFAMRQGNASMRDFVTTMSHLGTSAKAANMSLDEYHQGLMEFAQQARGVGAIGTQGMQLGRNVSDAMGVAPQVASQFLQNPMVQAQAMRQGVLPTELGMMNSQQFGQSLFGGIDLAMQASRGFANQPIRNSKGEVIMSGRQRQMNNAAQIMGIDHEFFNRLYNQRGTIQHGMVANNLLTNYSRGIDAWQKTVGSDPNVHLPHPIHGNPLEAGVKFLKEYKDPISNENWKPIDQQLRMMLPHGRGKDYHKYMDEIHSIEGKSGQDRVEAARKFITERSKVTIPDDKPVVYVRFKGSAAKLFEQAGGKNEARLNANAGRTSSANAAITPAPSVLSQSALQDRFSSMGIHGGGP